MPRWVVLPIVVLLVALTAASVVLGGPLALALPVTPLVFVLATRYPAYSLAAALLLVLLVPQGAKERNVVLDGIYGVAIALLLVGFANRARQGRSHATALGWFTWLFLVMLGINFCVALLRGVSLLDWAKFGGPFGQLVLGVLLARVTLANAEVEWLRRAIVASGLVSVGLIYYSYFAGSSMGDDADISRATVVFGRATVLALPLTLFAFALAGIKRTKLYLLVLPVTVLAVLLTQSRGFVVALAITAVAYAALMWRAPSTRLYATLTVLSAAVVLGILAQTPLWQSLIVARFDTERTRSDITIDARLLENELMLQYFLENPLVGRGFGEWFRLPGVVAQQNYTHSSFFFLLGHSGVLGVTAYFGLAITLLVRLVRQTLASQDSQRGFWAACAAGFAAMVFYSLTCTVYTAVSFNLVFATFIAFSLAAPGPLLPLGRTATARPPIATRLRDDIC